MLVLTACSAGTAQDQKSSEKIVVTGVRIVRQGEVSGCPPVPDPASLTAQPLPSDVPHAGKPVKVIPPRYPNCAEDRRVMGLADLTFTVEADGSVGDPHVIQEVPAGFGFANAALAVIPQWKFEPKLLDGKPVASQVVYRMNWKIGTLVSPLHP